MGGTCFRGSENCDFSPHERGALLGPDILVQGRGSQGRSTRQSFGLGNWSSGLLERPHRPALRIGRGGRFLGGRTVGICALASLHLFQQGNASRQTPSWGREDMGRRRRLRGYKRRGQELNGRE